MKHLALLLLVVPLLASPLLAADAEIEKCKLAYNKEQSEAGSKSLKAIYELSEMYLKGLESLKVSTQKTGNLDNTAAVIAEIKRYKAAAEAAPQPSAWPPLSKLQNIYQTEQNKIKQAEATAHATALKNLDARLALLEQQRVKSGDVEGAKLVRAERDKITLPEAPATPDAAPAPAKSEWISKNATYKVFTESIPSLPSLLSCEGQMHAPGAAVHAFHTKKQRDPHIIIDLGKKVTITQITIANRHKPRVLVLRNRAAGLKVWASDVDSFRIDPPIWTAESPKVEWDIQLEKPVTARYLKIGLEGDNRILHLRQVKVFGY